MKLHLVLLSTISLIAHAYGTTYYVSATGSDTANGSQSSPWKTIARVNSQQLQPGDKVLFKGGDTFESGRRTGNLITVVNSSFETGSLSGWIDWGQTTVTIDAADGTYAISIGDEGGFGQSLSSKLVPGKTYRLSFQSKVAFKKMESWFDIEFYDSSGNIIGEYTQTLGESADYLEYAISFTVPTQSVSSFIGFWNSHNTVPMVVDNIVIEELTPALEVTANGTNSAQVEIASYGSGKPTIDAGEGPGITITNSDYLTISGLHLTGGSYQTNSGNGISLWAGGGSHSHITFENLTIDNFGEIGIVVTGFNSYGYDTVTIRDSILHDFRGRGIYFHGHTGTIPDLLTRIFNNVWITDCIVYNCHDKLNSSNYKASGIELNRVINAVVEYCEVYQVGTNWSIQAGGPVGIWTWESDYVTIQYCESHHNRSRTVDGGGFDLDGGVTNSVIQYCYSHDNDASGYFLANFNYGRISKNNTIRYNISENDALRRTGSINVWGGVSDSLVYGNVVYAGPSTRNAFERESSSSGNRVFNNIFITNGGSRLLESKSTDRISYNQNLFYALDGDFKILWENVTYTSLAAWRTASGQEMLNGQPTGMEANPLLENPGTVGTIANPRDMVAMLSAYQLQTGSPAIDSGLDAFTLFSIDPGPRDFYGNAIPGGAAYDIGAHEYASGVPEIIATEGFEFSGWSGGTGWTSGWTRTGSTALTSSVASEGVKSGQIRDAGSSLERSLNLWGYTNVHVQADIRCHLLELGDSGQLQFYDGTNWTILETYTDNFDFTTISYDLSALTMTGSDQRVRLVANVDENNDIINIDAIVISGVPAVVSSILIAEDGFESGTWTDGTGWSGAWLRTGTTSFSSSSSEGAKSALIRDAGSSLERAVDLSGYSNIEIHVDIRCYILEAGDSASLEFFDGVNWITLDTYSQNAAFTSYVYDLSALTMSGSSQSLRLVGNLDEHLDFVYIDRVQIRGE